ncbi:glycosyltransferase family 4 protein [Serratia fonticola]|uniref:Glycosyltransferase family 4 protein n=1 Tax=Serratia fonticola TaxID=47917 RepID=A0AAJ1YG26_SERFO|nr:glycosyltransferase family 4 protein [Serratia fonticola]MDQ9129359.1 glycosyltransferase family 4 protein [Serratia fonticola]
MKIAIVHDWLVTYAGAERVLERMLNIFPQADIYSTVDFLENKDFILNKKVNTTFIQKLPFSKTKYRSYLPLMPLAIEQLDLSSYDLVISSSHAVAKGVLTGPDQVHICLCYSPIRYAWDLQHQYLKESNLTSGIKSVLARYILHRIRIWDVRTSFNVDHFIAVSDFIQARIKKCYRRESDVIYPPVYVDDFEVVDDKDDFYMTSSRQVPYKKIDLIVSAFNEMPDKKLIVIGDGPQNKFIKSIAKENISILGFQQFSVLKDHLSRAKAFVFAAEEDFGIAPLEAQACGTPVIAFGKGGAKETIVSPEMDPINFTGLFFENQTVEDIISSVRRFETMVFSSSACRRNAERFSTDVFDSKFEQYVRAHTSNFN